MYSMVPPNHGAQIGKLNVVLSIFISLNNDSVHQYVSLSKLRMFKDQLLQERSEIE